MSQSNMREISMVEVDQVSGGGVFGTISGGFAAAAAVGGGLAMVPTPATPALAVFAVVTGVLSGVFAMAEAVSS
jgi:hypothetical protein